MRKLRIIEHISLDGVIQAPGGKGEDGDYPYGGWSAQYDDPELGEAIVAAHSERYDLLLGRRTYDIWSGHWPKAKGPFNCPPSLELANERPGRYCVGCPGIRPAPAVVLSACVFASAGK